MKTHHDLFPTRVWEYRTDDDEAIDQALDYIKTLDLQMFNYPAGVRTSKGDIHKDPEMQPLMDFLNDAIDDVRCEQFLQVDELRISLAWGNFAPSGSGAGHPLHRHQYSYLSGVFYFTEGANTVFQDPVDIRNLDTLEIIRDNFDGPTERFEAERGKLLLFPGWLRHFSEPHVGDFDRYTMSFNTLPHGRVNAGPMGIPMAQMHVL